jgi:hypothetical protein
MQVANLPLPSTLSELSVRVATSHSAMQSIGCWDHPMGTCSMTQVDFRESTITSLQQDDFIVINEVVNKGGLFVLIWSAHPK